MLASMKEESWSPQALAGFRAYENVFCLEALGARTVAALCFPAIPAMLTFLRNEHLWMEMQLCWESTCLALHEAPGTPKPGW